MALDRSAKLVRAAAEEDDGCYLQADATALPLDDENADLVVAYNMLMNVTDLDRAVAEIGRVLTRGGYAAISITHPTTEAGRVRDDGSFVIDHDYLSTRPFDGMFSRDGLIMNFKGWSHPLERYAAALRQAGMLIELIREPTSPPSRRSSRSPVSGPWQRLPLFLWIRAVRATDVEDAP